MTGNGAGSRFSPQVADPRLIGGNRDGFSGSAKSKSYLWVGRLAHVDVEQMKCSIRFDSGTGDVHDVPITAPGGAGPRSYAGVIPEVGTRVLVAWSRVGINQYKPHIVGYLGSSVILGRDFASFSGIDPADKAYAEAAAPGLMDDPEEPLEAKMLKNRKAYPGDFIASSSSGSDILLDRDVTITNRSGVELSLRDSDMTVFSNSLNYSRVTSAGIYTTGMIRRNANNFLPDVYDSDNFSVSKPYEISDTDLRKLKIPVGSPAYLALLAQRLIQEDGSPSFINLYYQSIVESDGIHASFVYRDYLNQTKSYDEYPGEAYTEDRTEIRHVSNGIMSVTEESDGFNVDFEKTGYIEDVLGTVVGNDSYSPTMQKFYKKILGGRVFGSPSDKNLSPGLTFVDLNSFPLKPILTDTIALAKLFRIQSPTSSNEYAFAVTKEGRVYLNVPASQTGDVSEVGRSVDANIQGLLKAVIGSDANYNSTSMDLTTKGGINLDIGNDQDGNSINIILRGRIKKTYTSDGTGDAPVVDDKINGSASRAVSGSCAESITATKSTYVGGALNQTSFGHLQNVGIGGQTTQVAGDRAINVFGSESKTVALDTTHNYLIGQTVLVPLGFQTTNVLAGGIARNVTSGTGITDSVATGSFTQNVASGVFAASVVSGSMSLSVGTGPITLTASVSNTITSPINTINGAVSNVFSAPTTTIGSVVTGVAVAGIPGPGGPHLDYLTGLPILGIPTIAIG